MHISKHQKSQVRCIQRGGIRKLPCKSVVLQQVWSDAPTSWQTEVLEPPSFTTHTMQPWHPPPLPLAHTTGVDSSAAAATGAAGGGVVFA
jgi:hypothetical protein